MTVFDVARGIHIAAGFVALAVLWVPLFSGKGSRLHRKAGWVYVAAMAVVAVTAVAVCAWRLAYDGDPRQRVGSTFLLYVAVLAASSSSMGVRVLQAKTRTAGHRHPWDLGIASLLVLSGLLIFGMGVRFGVPLFLGFAPVGILTGAQQLVYWLRAPGERMHWWFQHMGAMFGSCIATVTAFVVVNAGHLGLPNTSLLVWLGPGAVGFVALAAWRVYYRRRFAGSTSVRGTPSAQPV